MKCGFDSKAPNSLPKIFLQVQRSNADLVGEFSTSADNCDDVLQIMACSVIAFSASVKGIEFCGKKLRNSYKPNFVVPDSDSLRVLLNRRIPGIAEAEDRRIGWHQVQYEVVIDSSAPRGAILDRFMETALTQGLL
jgi:hypothetical protein